MGSRVRSIVLEGSAGSQVIGALLPVAFDRGILLTYNNKRIVLGPFPTDEEWYGSILRTGVREVVSIIDPKQPSHQRFLEKAKSICKDSGLRFTSMPLDPASPSARDVQNLADYLRQANHRVFVMGIRNGNWSWALDAALGGGGAPFYTTITRDKFERGALLRVDKWLILGPYPTDEEIGLLRAAGVKEMVSLLDEGNPSDAPWILKEAMWSQLYGFRVMRFAVRSEPLDAAQVQRVVDYLKTQPGPVYVHGFRSDGRVQAVYEAARATRGQNPVPPPPGN